MNEIRLHEILDQFPRLRIVVVGDFFLDKYLLIDPELDEPSVETGLTAYQVVGKRRSPGAAGTVINNLKALGVGTLDAVGMSGVDGEGLELRMELTKLGVNQEHFYAVEERFTPTYTKPMILPKSGHSTERELNRFDIKNRKPLPTWIEYQIEKALESLIERVDAVMIMDQVSEENCGVITEHVREKITRLGRSFPEKVLYADSRERISLYENVLVKCNHYEVVAAFHPEYDLSAIARREEPTDELVEQCGWKMVEKNERSVFVTLGARGQWVFDAASKDRTVAKIPAIPVEGPIDICGAGDAASSGIVAALCCGASLAEAAFVGNLVASITIKQLGTTGTASPNQVRSAMKKHLNSHGAFPLYGPFVE